MESLIGCFSQRVEEDFINNVRDQVNVNSMSLYLPQYETKTTWLSKRKKVARKPKKTPYKASNVRLPQK